MVWNKRITDNSNVGYEIQTVGGGVTMIDAINEFWDWCKDNQENMFVDLHGDDLYLYLEFGYW